MRRSPSDHPAPAADGAPDLVGLTGLEDEDRKHVRSALTIAVALHAVLFSLDLPGMPTRTQPREARRAFPVQPTRYRPRPPEPQELIPQELPRRVPIPDPTPEGPDLLQPPVEIEVPVTLHYSDLVAGIPDAPPAPEPEAPLRVGGEVEPPVKIYAPPPRFTELARRARIEGTVIIEAIIDETGAVTDTKVLKALPMGLDQAAVEAVASWRFEPAMLRGEPVSVIYYLTVKFELSMG